MVVGVSFGLLAGTPRPTRSFAIINGGYAAFAVFFYFITPAVVASWGASGVFLMLAIAASVGASLLGWYPRERLPASRSVSTGLAAVPAFGWLAAVMLLSLAIGHAAIWSFVARLGEQHGLTHQRIGTALSVAALLTIAGPALASALDIKRGFALPMTTGVLAKAAIGAALVGTTSATAYFVLTPSFLLLNLFIIPYVMGDDVGGGSGRPTRRLRVNRTAGRKCRRHASGRNSRNTRGVSGAGGGLVCGVYHRNCADLPCRAPGRPPGASRRQRVVGGE